MEMQQMIEHLLAGQEHLMTMLNADHERMMARLEKTEATDLKVNPEEMESELEHWEVSQGVAAMKSSGTMKKQHRGRHLAAECCGKPKELTRGDSGSRRKLAATYRKVSHSARVAWHRRNSVRQSIRAKVERRIWKVRTLKERVWTCHKDRNGMKDLGGRQPRYLRKQDLKKL
jgi:hypothetical protein